MSRRGELVQLAQEAHAGLPWCLLAAATVTADRGAA